MKKIIIWGVSLVITAVVLRIGFGFLIGFMYPLDYREDISSACKEYELDEYFVMSVIRAESNFNKDAKSSVATGLMQITDETALWIFEKMGIDADLSELNNPQLNIRMGCYYLRYLSSIFNNRDVVLAAYNAGMGKVSDWLSNPEYSKDSKTLYNIPYSETREYIKKVNKYEDIYKRLYKEG